MTLLYDPVKRAPQKWVIAAVVLVPLILIIVFFVTGLNAVKNKPLDIESQEPDIFQKKQ